MNFGYDNPRFPRHCGGFTLIELLLVLGMMALIVGAVGVWLNRSMFTGQARPAAEVFYTAAAEARLLALSGGKPVRLWFDAGEQGFRIAAVEPAAELVKVGEPLPWEEEDRRWSRSEPASRRDAVGGALKEEAETGQARFFPLAEGSDARVAFFALYGETGQRLGLPLEAIVYHPSGASTPVEVVLEERGAASAEILQPDTFANGPSISRDPTAGAASTGGWR